MSYLCRRTNVQAKYIYDKFIDEYVEKAALVGQAFTTEAADVHTYIFRFASGNVVVDTNMISHAAEINCLLDFMSLIDHYEVVGVHTLNEVQSDEVLKILFYSCKKKSHML